MMANRFDPVHANEERLRLALEATGANVWDWDIEAGTVYFTDRWLESLGYDRDEVPSLIDFWQEITHPDDMPQVEAAMQAHLAGETPFYTCESRLRTRSGEYRYNLDRGKVVAWDENGRPLRMVGTDTDITDQKMMDAERRQLEQRMRELAAIVESSDDAIYSRDLPGRITSWNHAAERLFGYSAQEAIGQSIKIVLPPAEHPNVAPFTAALLSGEAIQPFEAQRVAKDGHLVDVSVALSPIRDAEGVIVGVATIVRDTSERKAMEHALRQANDHLEQMVAERTTALETALARLRRADRLKDAFMAAVSHELRTPLAAILGMTEVLLQQSQGSLSDRQQQYLRTIYSSGERLLGYVKDILSYTSLMAGRVKVEPQPFQVADLCVASIHTVRGQAEARRLAIALQVDPPDLAMVSDADSIVQVLQKLLDNAIKFTREGGEVGLDVRHEAGHDRVRFVVWDTGIGIDPAGVADLFNAFTQLEGSLARPFNGLGLGLAYVREAVHLLDGTIAVASERGSGSQFIVSLPRIAASPDPLAVD